MIEVDLSNPWLAVGVGVFVLLVLIVALIARRAPPAPGAPDVLVTALADRVSRLEVKHALTDDKVGHIDHDVRNIRQVVGNLPTKESIAAIGQQVAETRGQLAGIQTSINALTHANSRVEDFLMKVAGDALVDRVQEKRREPSDGAA